LVRPGLWWERDDVRLPGGATASRAMAPCDVTRPCPLRVWPHASLIIPCCFPAYASVTCQSHSSRPTSLLLCGRTPLQNALRSLDRPATTGRQALPRPVDEVLDHPDSGAQAFRRDI